MSNSSRLLVLPALAIFATLLLAPRASSARVPGCEFPELAVADFIDEWFASFLTNGAAGFEKLCLRMCKAGGKGCDQVRRNTVACNASSASALFGVDAIQCGELEGAEKAACLEGVKSDAEAFEIALAGSAQDAANACSAADADCLRFCQVGGPL